jgi:GntP family gluconate:H+ symporter
MLIGLGIGLVVLILLILKTKIHAFVALITAALIIGLIGGMGPTNTINAITAGFGGTLGSIGIIIGFGVMMGQIFEMSGAAEKMARTFLKIFGKKHESAALALTGFLVSIPIFCDSGFVILSPLAKALSKNTKKSIVALGVPLAAGLVITHSLVPPTPGPLGVAGTFGVDVGNYILLSIVISLPMMIGTLIYGKNLGKKIYQIPSEDGDGWVRPPYQEPVYDLKADESTRKLPNAFFSFLPIVAPIILILVKTISDAVKLSGPVYQVIALLGAPIVAVGIGLVLAIYTLAFKTERKVVISKMEEGIRSAGIIILVTGGGGALGKVLQTSGVGNFIADKIAATAIPVILLPFIIATLVRFVQGSGTVAMITSAGITAPIVAAAGGNMLVGALAACIGSLFFSYFNDSYFWVTTRLMGITDTKEQIRVWSFTSTIAWAIGLIELLIVNLIIR